MELASLAYLGLETTDTDRWRDFGQTVLGMTEASEPSGDTVRLRMDAKPARLLVHGAARDGLAYVGWEVTGDDVSPDGLLGRLKRAKVSWHEPESLTAIDGVTVIAAFDDPWGLRHELVRWREATPSREEVLAPNGGTARPVDFVTGHLGLGHFVLYVSEMKAALPFFVDVMGMRISDSAGEPPVAAFLRCNPRHHSMAVAQHPHRTGLQHLMIEVATLDDVGSALDAAHRAGASISRSLGRHPNDRMISFYVRSPSGFDIEYGTGGLHVDEQTWKPATTTVASIWGHRSQ